VNAVFVEHVRAIALEWHDHIAKFEFDKANGALWGGL
jgi:hypothetical protein